MENYMVFVKNQTCYTSNRSACGQRKACQHIITHTIVLMQDVLSNLYILLQAALSNGFCRRYMTSSFLVVAAFSLNFSSIHDFYTQKRNLRKYLTLLIEKPNSD